MNTRVLELVVVVGLFGAGSAAHAQDNELAEEANVAEEARLAEADPLGTIAVDEEVVVRGKLRRSALRVQIELAEEAFYNRFNDINSNDEFDIVCRREVELGSKIPKRNCQPNFWRKANEHVGRETVLAMQGSSYAMNPQLFMGEAHFKHGLLEEEMRELAAADAGLREALARLATLQQAYENYDD